jgi:hypothetical protein
MVWAETGNVTVRSRPGPGWLLCLLLVSGAQARAAPSLVARLGDGIYEVRDDGGQWPGSMSRDITH